VTEKNILVVDDEQEPRSMMEKILLSVRPGKVAYFSG